MRKRFAFINSENFKNFMVWLDIVFPSILRGHSTSWSSVCCSIRNSSELWKKLIQSNREHSTAGRYYSWWETVGYAPEHNFCRGSQYSAVCVCKLDMYITEISLVVIWSCWSVEHIVSLCPYVDCTEDSLLSVGVSHPKKSALMY